MSTKEKMREYTLLTGSTEAASRLIEAEATNRLAEAQEKLAEALSSKKKKRLELNADSSDK